MEATAQLKKPGMISTANCPMITPPGFHKRKHAGRDREDGGGGMVGWGYGSVEGVLRGTCRVSDEDIETIRERLAAETSLL